VLETPRDEELDARLDAVHQSLYLLFNEGYSASRGERAIRVEVCEEAARLCHLLCSQARFATPATQALMALMLFHAARFDARVDGAGALLLIDEQDRGRWDKALIERAQEFHDASARGRKVSTYHLQAGIAALHCATRSYAETDWHAILRLYDALTAIDPSPVYALNRAVVVAELDGPLEGIRALEAVAEDRSLRHYHLLDATLGELHRRAGDVAKARAYLAAARDKTTSSFDRDLIDRRLAACDVRDSVP
jgi:predicted RNA polymerase sigma factor